MKSSLTTAMILLTAATLPAPAQQQPPQRAPNITRSGQTVPNPSTIDSEGVDRTIQQRTPDQQRNDKIDSSICKGC